jgi:hypothetical protein
MTEQPKSVSEETELPRTRSPGRAATQQNFTETVAVKKGC